MSVRGFPPTSCLRRLQMAGPMRFAALLDVPKREAVDGPERSATNGGPWDAAPFRRRSRSSRQISNGSARVPPRVGEQLAAQTDQPRDGF